MKQTGRILLVTALLVAVVIVASTSLSSSGTQSSGVPIAVNAAQVETIGDSVAQSTATSNTLTQVYYDVSPSVVAIRVAAVSRNRVVSSGTGSGFVVDEDGHIVTNNHVVDGATQIEVEFYDGTLVWADLVGVDPDSDLAVLHVDVPAEELQPVTFGDSDALQIGETVLAIGSPFGQDWTLTSGIVSGLDRTIQGLNEFSIGGVIQTDAAINPGNSGGPLLDLSGNVIGVNSQIMSTSSSNSGVGFAVPSNLTQRVVEALIADGEVAYSYIGISGTDLTLSLIDALGLPDGTRGVVITETMRGGPAANAGLRTAGSAMNTGVQSIPAVYDIITAIDGYPIKGMDDLISYLARETSPGQAVKLTVLREGNEWVDVAVTLTPRP